MKDEDFIDRLFVANTHDTILCFSSRGRAYWLKVYEVPEGTRNSRGKPIVNLFPLVEGEKITAVLPVKEFDENHYVFMATAMGTVKKTSLTAFSNPRKAGIIAVNLDDGDHLIGVAITDGESDVMLFSDSGKAVRFGEGDVRPMGREARGVRGMTLEDGQLVIAMLVANSEEQSVLTATENGFGKRTPVAEYTRHGRGTKGMIAIQTSERNGKLVAAVLVEPDGEIMLISTGGVLIRTKVTSIREMGRSTQGVTLISLDDGTFLAGVEKVAESDEDPDLDSEDEQIEASGKGRGRWRRRGRERRRRMSRVFNFSAGPAVLPEEVLRQAAEEMLDWQGSGMGVMEMSHRGKEFMSIYEAAEANLRELLAVPANFRILFMQGGAIAENAIIPLNLLGERNSADYVLTGSWTVKSQRKRRAIALQTLRRPANPRVSRRCRRCRRGVCRMIRPISSCTNETIGGVEYPVAPDMALLGRPEVPVVADVSSHILSRPVDFRNTACCLAAPRRTSARPG